MSAPADSFAAWAASELGLQGAAIAQELSGGNSNLTRLVGLLQFGYFCHQ